MFGCVIQDVVCSQVFASALPLRLCVAGTRLKDVTLLWNSAANLSLW